jgi:hypothetical protein
LKYDHSFEVRHQVSMNMAFRYSLRVELQTTVL